MAWVNILAKGKHALDWRLINSKVNDMQLECAEVFPIPKATGARQDCIAISIPGRFPRERVKTELIRIIKALETHCAIFVELYDGDEYDADALIAQVDRFVKNYSEK